MPKLQEVVNVQPHHIHTPTLRTEMGLFNRRKVDGEPGADATTNDITTSRTGIRRFGRTRKTTDVPSSRPGTGGLGVLKAMRLVQLLLAILILGLTAYAVNVFSSTFVSQGWCDAYGQLD